MMALLTTPGFQLNEAARLDGKKRQRKEGKAGAWRGRRGKQGDFFWRVTERGKGGRAAGEKSLLVGNFSRPDSFSDLAIDSQYVSPFQTWYWFSHCPKIKWIMACTIIPIPSHVHVVASMTP
ncbi:hypothetical protein AAG906_020638 [Vitis piasezkii]